MADATANTITELPITGTKFTLSSQVSDPHGLTTDSFGNLYVADTGNNRVLVYGPGAALPTVAGFSGLNAPQAVAVDANANLYAADSSHVVELTPAGIQTTVATVSGATGVAVDPAGDVLVTSGTTLTEYPANDAAAVTVSSALVTASALAMDTSGNAYIADSGQSAYVFIQRTAGYYKFTSSPSNTAITLTSEGTSTLATTSYTQSDSTDFSLVPSTTNGCSGGLASGNTCSLTGSFNPTSPGTLTDSVTFSGSSTNASPIKLTLTGTTAAQSTTTVLKLSTATLVYGSVETLTATVSATLSAPTSGTVNFYNSGTTLLGSANVGANGVAVLNLVPSAGAYSVTATFVPTGIGYYGSTTAGASSFAVTQAVLTVTANNASKLYQAANPALTYTITGFVNSDTQSSATTGLPTESTTATTTSSVGSYPITITQGTLAATNYTFSFVNGTLSITGATAQSITFGALPGVTYGISPISLTATASSGLAVSYSVTGPASISGSTLTVTGAGTIAVTASQTGNNTYAAAATVTQSFASAQAALNVAAVSASRVYGTANPTLTYTITGFVNGDSQVTATAGAPAESTTALVTSGVGGYPITVAQGTLSSNNYSLTFTSGTLTVTAAKLTLTANSASRVYGTANPTFSGSISGIVNNDPLVETFATTAITSTSPGTYAIVPGATGTNAGNYSIAASNGVLTITQATPIEVISTSATSGYNGSTNITLTATLSSPTSGAPTGTVAFMAGTTVVGTMTIAGSTAVLTTSALPVGSDSVTAVYSGDSNFFIHHQLAGPDHDCSRLRCHGFCIHSEFSGKLPGGASVLEHHSRRPHGYIDLRLPGSSGATKLRIQSGEPAAQWTDDDPERADVGVQLFGNGQRATFRRGWSSTARAVTLAILPILFIFGRRRRLPSTLLACMILVGLVTLGGCGSSPTALEVSYGTYSFTATVNSGTTVLQTIDMTLTIP